jgi:hypothetical protein
MGEMRRRKRECLFDIVHRAGHFLTGQPVHEIQIEVAEARGVQLRGGAAGIRGGMNAPQGVKRALIEALRAKRDAADPDGAVLAKRAALDGAGVRLQRHLRILRDVEVSARGFQDRPDGCRREQARRPAAEEHARHNAPPDLRRLCGDIARKSRHVRLLRELAVQGVRVEVAVRALPYAPRKVHIERERWGNECGHAEASYGTRAEAALFY